ncbi:MAG TPA: hypothetical protein VNY36_05935 [Bacteroidia bacterium]|jgi:hypothetical protein|nr:hypothetical protein [Bacteroidia bacterium]
MKPFLIKYSLVILITLFALTQAKGQFNACYINAGYHTDISTNNINLGLIYELSPTVDSIYKLVAFSAGIEYSFNNTQPLIETGIYYALRQEWICYVYMGERYSTWFVAAHYKFTPQLDKQFICPEFGYDCWIDTHFFIAPSINYYYDLKSMESAFKSIYLGLEVRYDIIPSRR